MGIAVGIATLVIAGLVLRSIIRAPSDEVATAVRVTDRWKIAELPDNTYGRIVGEALALEFADGRREPVAFDKITARIMRLCKGLDEEHIDPILVAQKVHHFSGRNLSQAAT